MREFLPTMDLPKHPGLTGKQSVECSPPAPWVGSFEVLSVFIPSRRVPAGWSSVV